jgi:hypothetical protein
LKALSISSGLFLWFLFTRIPPRCHRYLSSWYIFISLIHIVMNRRYTHRMRLLFLYMTILQRILLVRRLFMISNSNSFYFIINIIAVIRCFFMRYCGDQKYVFFISLMNYFSWKCYFSHCSNFFNA